jgi:hypothetical protein
VPDFLLARDGTSTVSMQSTYYLITQFIKEERYALAAQESNYFALVFGEMAKYYEYLIVVWPRYKKISTIYVRATKERWARRLAEPAGSRTVTEEELRELEVEAERQTLLHLELETIFIFSSILLDRIAACTQYYFGRGSGQWSSFKSMKKHLKGYCQNRGLPAPSEKMMEVIQWLYKNVSEFRNLLVVHKHENDYRVRLHFGTAWSHDDDEAYFSLGLASPQGDEQPFLSEKPQNILKNLNQFLEQWVQYLRSNRDKRNLSPNA